MLTEKKQLVASAHGNVAAAEISDGQRAQVQKFGDKGGIAQIPGHKYVLGKFLQKIFLQFNLRFTGS